MKLVPLLCTVLLACGGKATKQVAPGSAPAPDDDEKPASAPTEPAEPPLALALRVERSVDGVALYVANRGTEVVSLAPDVALTQRDGTAYRTLEERALTLRFDCQSQGCVELAPGAELAAPSWYGRADGERCGALAALPGVGGYQLVVKSCRGTQEARVGFEQSTPP